VFFRDEWKMESRFVATTKFTFMNPISASQPGNRCDETRHQLRRIPSLLMAAASAYLGEPAVKTEALVNVAGEISHLLKPEVERTPRDGPTAGPAPRRPSAGSDERA
jgi:hypothetical protein